MYLIRETRFAYFSEAHDNFNRDSFVRGFISKCPELRYITLQGEIVRPTSLGKAPVPSDSGYMWPDARCLGQVIAHLDERETVRNVARFQGGQFRFYVHPDELKRSGWFLQDGVQLTGCLGDVCQLADVTSK